MLREAAERGVLDSDALTMLEGVLEVGRSAGARHHGAARADGVRAARRARGAHPAGGGRVRPLALSGDGRGPRRHRRDPAREGPAAPHDRREARALRHARVHAPGGVRAGVQAPQRAAEGIPPQPQSHGDRGR